MYSKLWPMVHIQYTLSGRIGKVVAAHAEVARLIPGGGWECTDLYYACVMGNFGEAVKFPICLGPSGTAEPRRRNWYCAAGFTSEQAAWKRLSQSTAFRVERSFGVVSKGRLFCVKGPRTWLESRIGIPGLLWVNIVESRRERHS